jgi:uncharacterized protein YndB with AHSA1/START domain
MSDVVERTITIAAPIDRVWSAITEVEQFNSWFGVRLQQPFVAGSSSRGPMAVDGFEHLLMTIDIETVEPPHRFGFRWHPHAIDATRDYSAEPKTLVEFLLDSVAEGTRVTVRESGFDHIPAERRDTAWRSNDNGWNIQLGRIRAHVEG